MMRKQIFLIFGMFFIVSCSSNVVSTKLNNNERVYSKENTSILNKIDHELHADNEKIPSAIDQIKENSVNDFGQSIFHLAVERKSFITLKYLIDKKYNINMKDEFGDTALLLAIRLNFDSVASFLIDNNADVTVQDYFGDTPLSRSIDRFQDNVMVKILSIKSYDVTEKEKKMLEEYYMLTTNQHLRRLILSKTK